MNKIFLLYMLHVGDIKSLKNCPHAKGILERLANDVEPIMKKRGWKIRTLSEFYPKNPQLLGVNINKKDIKIRLRAASDYQRILEYHDLIGTMLHELVHFEISAHDQRFYSLLDEIYTEYEGQSGLQIVYQDGIARFGAAPSTPFQGPGRKLGGIPKSRTGQRLGGNRSTKSMRELVLDAALRRQRDSLWCASQDSPEIIDLTTPRKKQRIEIIVIDE
jgi:hypothetical protein